MRRSEGREEGGVRRKMSNVFCITFGHWSAMADITDYGHW